jgi:hypothetical protein
MTVRGRGSSDTRYRIYLLWAVLLCTVPVPFFMVQIGWVPVARLLVLSTLGLAVLVTEPGFDAGFVTGLLVPQTLLAAGLLRVVAGRLGSTLERAAPGWRDWLTGTLITLLIGLALQPIYRTPLSTLPQGNLLGLLQ